MQLLDNQQRRCPKLENIPTYTRILCTPVFSGTSPRAETPNFPEQPRKQTIPHQTLVYSTYSSEFLKHMSTARRQSNDKKINKHRIDSTYGKQGDGTCQASSPGQNNRIPNPMNLIWSRNSYD